MLKDSSLLKIQFGISGDFFTYFLLQYFQRTLFCYSSVFTDCKDRNFILIRKNFFSLFFFGFRSGKISLFNLVIRTTACESGCKDRDFYFASPNVLLNFFKLNFIWLIICILLNPFQ